MSTHTPGPWSFDDYSNLIRGSDGWSVANFEHAGCPDIDDLPLILAAPDLLEALKDFVAEFGECGLTEKARTAIAKAEGRE